MHKRWLRFQPLRFRRAGGQSLTTEVIYHCDRYSLLKRLEFPENSNDDGSDGRGVVSVGRDLVGGGGNDDAAHGDGRVSSSR